VECLYSKRAVFDVSASFGWDVRQQGCERVREDRSGVNAAATCFAIECSSRPARHVATATAAMAASEDRARPSVTVPASPAYQPPQPRRGGTTPPTPGADLPHDTDATPRCARDLTRLVMAIAAWPALIYQEAPRRQTHRRPEAACLGVIPMSSTSIVRRLRGAHVCRRLSASPDVAVGRSWCALGLSTSWCDPLVYIHTCRVQPATYCRTGRSGH